MNQKLITREILEPSSSRTWIRQGTSHRESTDRPALPPNSSLTLYLTIFYLQRIAPNVENYFSLDCRPLLEEVHGSFCRGHQAACGPMNLWQLIISTLDLNWHWYTANMDSQRRSKTVIRSGDRQVGQEGQPAPPSDHLGRFTVVCLRQWIRGPLSQFYRGWSWFVLTSRSALPVSWINHPKNIDSPKLVEFVNLNS